MNKTIIITLCAILIITICVAFNGCADQNKRLNNLKTMYPNCKVEPATGIIQLRGFEFIVIDTSFQIVAVSFYPFSETRIFRLRNIR